jgi:hypothetical protein
MENERVLKSSLAGADTLALSPGLYTTCHKQRRAFFNFSLPRGLPSASPRAPSSAHATSFPFPLVSRPAEASCAEGLAFAGSIYHYIMCVYRIVYYQHCQHAEIIKTEYCERAKALSLPQRYVCPSSPC